jgi:hypothetical protein
MARGHLAPLFALALLALPSGANGQAGKKPPAVKPPSPAEVQRAADNFRILISGLQSEKVPQAVKNVLFICAYSNPFAKISEGTDKVIADKKLDRKNPTQVLSAMAAVCGFRPEMANPPKK